LNWDPHLFVRKFYENWVSEGKKTLFERSNERVIDILDHYEPEPLPKDFQQKFKDIIARAEAKIGI
jgi:trimethylamine---corrinoid protein Co-methyltransferase